MLRTALKYLAVLAVTVIATSASAETYYVATDGKESNNGSAESPWPSVNYALARVGGGHTIIVRPGIYMEPILIPRSAAGTKTQPTVIKSEVKWKAVILGAKKHGIATEPGCHRVVIDGFEVMSARTGDGIRVNGNHCTVRNCYVHNNARTGIAVVRKAGTVIENNLVEYNGQSPPFHHGIHASGSNLTIRANVIRHNSGSGLNTAGDISGSLIANNLIHSHLSDTHAVLIYSRRLGARNRFLHNTVVDNNGGVRFHNSNGDMILNNILMTRDDSVPLEVVGAEATAQADYNLCSPASPHDGPHTLHGDPKFVDPSKGTYWLLEDSPVIGKGTRDGATSTDFWGRPLPRAVPPSLGAFAFSAFLTTEAARANWYFQWPYRYSEEAGYDVPDFWIPPPD